MNVNVYLKYSHTHTSLIWDLKPHPHRVPKEVIGISFVKLIWDWELMVWNAGKSLGYSVRKK